MQRNRIAPSLVAFLSLGGCTQHSPRVFVDLEKALSAEPAYAKPEAVNPQPVPSPGAPEVVLPALPEQVLTDVSSLRSEDARRLLEENRQRAYRTILRNLREVYTAEVSRAEAEALAALQPERRAEAERMIAAIRDIFESYAEERGPKLARLAVLSGFPDPDPASRRRAVTDHPVVVERLDESRTLRAEIAELDREYGVKIDRLAAELQTRADESLTRVKAEFEQARLAAQVRAEGEAETQVRKAATELNLRLVGIGQMRLPAVPGTTLPAEPSSIPPPAPVVEAKQVLGDLESRRRAARQELEIWLAINGYRESSTRRGANDRTEQFIAWRQSHRPGP